MMMMVLNMVNLWMMMDDEDDDDDGDDDDDDDDCEIDHDDDGDSDDDDGDDDDDDADDADVGVNGDVDGDDGGWWWVIMMMWLMMDDGAHDDIDCKPPWFGLISDGGRTICDYWFHGHHYNSCGEPKLLSRSSHWIIHINGVHLSSLQPPALPPGVSTLAASSAIWTLLMRTPSFAILNLAFVDDRSSLTPRSLCPFPRTWSSRSPWTLSRISSRRKDNDPAVRRVRPRREPRGGQLCWHPCWPHPAMSSRTSSASSSTSLATLRMLDVQFLGLRGWVGRSCRKFTPNSSKRCHEISVCIDICMHNAGPSRNTICRSISCSFWGSSHVDYLQ